MTRTSFKESASGNPSVFVGRVLIAEDVAVNRQVIARALGRLGLKVSLCADGRRALELASENDYDLILMDIQLPFMDGLAVVRELRLAGCTVPIVAISASSSPTEISESLSVGCNAFLAKPFERAALVATLAKFLVAGAPVNVDDRELSLQLKRLSKAFVDSLANRLTEIEQAFAERRFDSVHTLAHRLKGAAGSLGFEQLRALAGELEGPTAPSPEVFSGLLRALRDAISQQPDFSPPLP